MKDKAIRAAEAAVAILPVSEDAIDGPGLLYDLAVTYVIVGEPERAIDQLERLVSIPSWYSVTYLEIAPEFKPLREHPRFQALLERGDVVF